MKQTARAWYLIGVGLIISALCMTIVAFGSMLNGIEGMQRVVMPGSAQIHLPPGTSTLYAEQRSKLGGKTYEVSDAFQYRCGIDDKLRKVTFRKAATAVHYGIGDYAGAAAWDVDVVEDGDYTLVCESEQQFVMACGRGVGSWIVVGVVGLVPFFIGLAGILIVFFRRRRQRSSMG